LLPVRAVFYLISLFAAACCASAAGAPFDFVDGYAIVHATIHGQPVNLLLDSGASASILGINTARRLHIPLGEAEPVDGVDASATAYHIAPTQARSGATDFGTIALAIDLGNAARLCSERIDGLIGADFLKGRVTQIDYAKRQLRILDAAPDSGESLPLLAHNGIYCVQLSVNGSHPRWTRLDTGCNDALHWVIPRSEPENRRGVSVGFFTNSADETLTTLRLGHRTLPRVETVLHGSAIFPGEAGLLGSEILSQYRVTIDCVHGRLVLD
jgi:hypothetical protein